MIAVLPADDAGLDKAGEGLHGVWCAEHRMAMAVHELQILNRVLDVDHASRAEFGIDGARFNQLCELLTAEVEGGCHIPRCPAIDVAVAMDFDLVPEVCVACSVAELDHRLAFERRSKPLLAVIGRNL